MLLDPFTIGAQIVNFLVLIWLLRRVLYGPITSAMHERDERIRRELDEAARMRADVEAERERHREQVADFAATQDARLADARAEVETWRQAQMDSARQEIDARRASWQHALEQQQKTVVRDLRQKVGREILSLTRGVLRDLAGSDLQERIVARFLQQLREMPADERTRLAAAAREDGGRVHLCTAFALDDVERGELADAIDVILGTPLSMVTEIAPEIGSGVELRAGGLKVGWSLTEYLESLDERLAAAFGDVPAYDHERA